MHIGFPYFCSAFCRLFLRRAVCRRFGGFAVRRRFLLLLFKQHRQRPNFVLSLIATAAAFAVFAVAMNLFVLPTERYDGGTYTVTGNVESFLTKSNGRFYYKLHVTQIDEPVQDVDFSVRLSHSEAFPAEIGDTVACEAKFFAFEDSLGLSPRTSWLADNMVLSAYVTDYESVQVTPAEKRPFSYYVNQIRTHFHNLILENYPKTEGSVLSAMLLGLRDDMETELVSAYKKAGASHILAISGMHMAVLTQFTLGFLGLLGLKRRPAACFRGVYAAFYVRLGAFGLCGAQRHYAAHFAFRHSSRSPGGTAQLPCGRRFDHELIKPVLRGRCLPVVLVFGDARHHPACAPHHKSSHEKYSQAAAESTPCKACFCIFRLAFGGAFHCAAAALFIRHGAIRFGAHIAFGVEISAWLLRFGLIAALLLAVPVLSPCAAPFVFLSGICVKAQTFIITLIAEHIPGTLRISGKYLPVTVVICVLFFTLSMLLYRRKNKALPCVLTVCILLCGMGANALLNQSAARLVVFRTDYAACTAIITTPPPRCSGAAEMPLPLRPPCARTVRSRSPFLHVQPDEKSIRCAEKLHSFSRSSRFSCRTPCITLQKTLRFTISVMSACFPPAALRSGRRRDRHGHRKRHGNLP